MKVFGIILEANPLHKGHEYFINQVKEVYKPDILIAITSTSFTMRGEISLLNKFDKTKLLLNQGIDLVFELPFTLAVQSADYFAKNSVDILSHLGITDLVFGSETDNLEEYDKLYQFIKTTSDYQYDNRISYKQNYNSLLEKNFSKTEIDIINKPNFTLGFSYYKYIKDNNLDINIHLIKRISNNYDDKLPTSNIASATSIRCLLLNNENVSNYISYSPSYLIDINKSNENLMILLRHIFITNGYTNSDYEQKEGFFNYIKNNGNFWRNFPTLQDSLKNKKYTINKINRMFLHALLETRELNKTTVYLRMLGTNDSGISYINTLNKTIKQAIFSSPKELSSSEIIVINETELKATKLYQNITNNENLYMEEYKLPIRKEKI